MYKDVSCPYCGLPQDINHDDGYGYQESVIHNQQCGGCDKYFTFTTSISFSYEVEQADCLNGAEHDFKPTNTFPKEYTRMECSVCGESRALSEEEKRQIINTNPPQPKE
jgi:hypothetical protein